MAKPLTMDREGPMIVATVQKLIETISAAPFEVAEAVLISFIASVITAQPDPLRARERLETAVKDAVTAYMTAPPGTKLN